MPQFDDITVLESRGNSNYHSLQARFQQSLQRGLTALASYTWSKSIDDASGFFSSAGDPNYPQDSLHASLERGLSNFDLRHRLSLSYSYDLPLGRGRLRGGWQTFGIWTFQSGRPFTVALLSDLDNSNTGRSNLGFGANDRPNVLRNPELSERTPGALVRHHGIRAAALRQLRQCRPQHPDRPGVSEHQRVAGQEHHAVLSAPRCSSAPRRSIC